MESTNVTSETVRKVVEEEGLEARNLLNWSVPVGENVQSEASRVTKKPPTSPRPQSASPRPPSIFDLDCQTRFRRSKRCCSLGRPKSSRVRSASAGRNPEKDLRARYWAFLFDNLYRAVDEIYQTCETDESIVECKEAILMLENYCKEFRALIQWLNIKRSYENTAPLNRPTSLAWEVRKSSPGKTVLRNMFIDKLMSGNSSAKRFINFDLPNVLSSVAIQTDSGDEKTKTVSCPEEVTVQFNHNSNVNEANEITSFVKTEQVSTSSVYGEEVKFTGGNEDSTALETPLDLSCSRGTYINGRICDDSHSLLLTACNTLGDEMMHNRVVEEYTIPKTTKNPFLPDKESNNEGLATSTSEGLVCENSVDVCLSNDANNVIADVNTSEVNDVENSPKIENSNVESSKSVNENKEKDATFSESINEISENGTLDLPIVFAHSEQLPNNMNSSLKSSDIKISANSKTQSKAQVTIGVMERNLIIKAEGDKGFIPVKFPKCLEASIDISAVKDATTSNCTSNSGKICPPENTVKHIEADQNVYERTIENVLSGSTSGCQASISNPPKLIPQQKSLSSTSVVGQKLSRYQGPSKNNTEGKKYGAYSPSQAQQRKCYGLSETNGKRNISTPGNLLYKRPYPKQQVSSFLNSNTTKPMSSQNGKMLPKDQQKNGSSSSLSSTSSGKSWADKVKGPNMGICDIKISTDQKTDENDGWETVKGRARCRNSPAKKLIPNSDSRDSQVSLSSPIQHAKMGGFPYSCTAISTPSQKKSYVVQNGCPSVKNSAENLIGSKKTQISDNFKHNKNSNKIRSSATARVQENGKLREPPVKNTQLSKSFATISPKSDKVTSMASIKTNALGNRNKTMIVNTGGSCPKPVKRQLSADDLSHSKLKGKNMHANEFSNAKKHISPLTHEVGSGDYQGKNKKSTSANEKQYATSNVKKLHKAKNVGKHCSLTRFCSDSNVSQKSCVTSNTKSLKKSSSLEDKITDVKCSEQFSDIDKGRNSDFKTESLKEFEWKDCINNDSIKSLEETPYESDIGHTSDDQDGMISQDEESLDQASLDWYDQVMREEAQERVHKLGLSWGDQMDCFDMELRTPGRALQMHEKLSSPFKKRSLSETIRWQEEKQLKAQEQRERLLEEKAQRFKDIAKKVEEMRVWKEKRQERQRLIMEEKLQRAEEKRKKQLQKIIRKAHDEEEKVNEIAFINTLEAQNKRHDLISKEKDHEARLQDIQDERQRRLEEKAAKEAAAEERRKVLEADRQARLLEMQERRKLRDQKIEQQLMEKEKERQELANQKARDREQRLSALNAAQQATLEELQKKIQLKQEESARRHEENMEQIRQKAFELSIRRCSSNNDDVPQLVPYETKKICTICNVLIGSEVYLLSHLRGKKHQETVKDQHQGQDPSTEELELYNLKHIVDASADQLDPNIALDKERQKALKKRCKKLRQRMTNRGLEYETTVAKEKEMEIMNSQFKNKMGRIVRDIKKYVTNEGKGPWDIHIVSSLERALGELERLFEKCNTLDKVTFRALGGIGTLLEVLNLTVCTSKDNFTLIPNKTIVRTCLVTALASDGCYDNSHYVVFGNKISTALDLLMLRLNMLIPDNFCQLLNINSGGSAPSIPVDQIAAGLMKFLSIVLNCLSTRKPGFTGIQHMIIEQSDPNKQEEEFQQIVHDVISYIVSIGIVDKLSMYFNAIRGPINSEPDIATFLLSCMSFLTALAKLYSNSYDCVFDGKKSDDSTQLLATFKVTNMVGTVSLLYGILLHSGAPSRGEIAPQLPEHTQHVIVCTLQMLNHVATIDLQVVQYILGSEGLSLQLRHIASYLLWYCTHWTSDDLLHEVILLVGYFTSLSPDNQIIIQAGQRPTVLQQLCSLPFHYFSDPHLTNILFPTLIACCFRNAHNKAILEQEMSSELLSNYIEAHLLDLHQAALFPSKNKKTDKIDDIRWMFSARFPKDRWTSAKLYFSNEE